MYYTLYYRGSKIAASFMALIWSNISSAPFMPAALSRAGLFVSPMENFVMSSWT